MRHSRSANRRSPSIPTMSKPCWRWGSSSTCRRRFAFSGDPKGDIERADQLFLKALALDPNWTWPHDMKGNILRVQGRAEEAVAEHERALVLDPSNTDAAGELGVDYMLRGEFDKSLEYFDKAIRGSPYDPAQLYWYGGKAEDNFGLKR